MGEGVPAAPSGAWTGRNLAIVIGILVITNAVTGVTVFFVTQPVEERLVVIGPWAGAEMDAFMPVLRAFTNETGIEVEYRIERQEDLRTILPTSFAAEETPGDVIFMVASSIREEYGPDGHAMEVSEFVDEASFLGALDPVKKDGNLYGGVYTGKIKPGFWYRQSFFTANALSVPTTYAEFVTLLADISAVSGIENAIVSGDGVGWPLSDVTEHFIATYGGAQMHIDLTEGTLSFTDPTVRDVFETYLVPLLEAGYFSEPLTWDSTALDGWWAGDYGLYFMGSWITGMVDDPGDLGVFSLPPEAGAETGMVFGGDHFFIPTYTTRVAEARWLFEWLSSAEAQEIQVSVGGHIATAPGVSLDAYPALDRDIAELKEAATNILLDMDDWLGSPFQDTFWSQLQGLWTSADPAGDLSSILTAIEADH